MNAVSVSTQLPSNFLNHQLFLLLATPTLEELSDIREVLRKLEIEEAEKLELERERERQWWGGLASLKQPAALEQEWSEYMKQREYPRREPQND